MRKFTAKLQSIKLNILIFSLLLSFLLCWKEKISGENLSTIWVVIIPAFFAVNGYQHSVYSKKESEDSK